MSVSFSVNKDVCVWKFEFLIYLFIYLMKTVNVIGMTDQITEREVWAIDKQFNA